MARVLAAAALAVHGLIHLIGFVVPWGIAAVDGFPYRTAVLGGAVPVGDAGVRVVGVAWLLLAVAFVVTAAAAWRRAPVATGLAAALAVASTGVCLLGLPEAGTGIVVNLAILAVVALRTVTGRRPAGVLS